MKSNELKDEQDWIIFHDDENEKNQYIFTDENYLKLLSVIVFADFALDYPLLEGPHQNAPNLNLLGLIGKGCINSIQNINENGISAPILENIYFDSTGITQIPEFVLNISILKHLTFRHEKNSALPHGQFNLINLQTLRFQYDSGIRVIPEEIKNLVNLEQLDLWGATLEFLSPKIFLLPKISDINFAFSNIKPKGEFLQVVKKIY